MWLVHHVFALTLGTVAWWWLNKGSDHILMHAQSIQMVTMVLVAVDSISIVCSILDAKTLEDPRGLRGTLEATWWWPLVVIKIVLDSPAWWVFLRLSIQCAASWYVDIKHYNVPSLIVFVWGVAWLEYSRRSDFLTVLRIRLHSRTTTVDNKVEL